MGQWINLHCVCVSFKMGLICIGPKRPSGSRQIKKFRWMVKAEASDVVSSKMLWIGVNSCQSRSRQEMRLIKFQFSVYENYYYYVTENIKEDKKRIRVLSYLKASPFNFLFPSQLKVVIPLWRKMPFKWLVKPLRVSSPLKLKNTSYLYWRLKEEDEALLLVKKAIVIWIYR